MSDIDVLVVSDDLTLEEMFAALEDAERDLGRTVSPTLYTSDEFRRRRRSGHPFVTGVLDGPHIVLVGEPAYRALEKTMDKVLQEILRNECLAKARSQNKLVEKEKVQYWHFYRHGHDGPFLVISKPGRRVIHVKGVTPAHALWKHIEADDPKHVGSAWEIRLMGDASEVRAAFDDGLAKLIAS